MLTQDSSILILGAVSSGKTSLLSALYRCSQDHMLEGTGWSCKIRNVSDDLMELHKAFGRISESGVFQHNATTDYSMLGCDMIIKKRGKGFFAPDTTSAVKLTVPDYPGGRLYRNTKPEHMKQREQLLEFLKGVSGLIICLPADAPEVSVTGTSQAEFMNDLSDFIMHHPTLDNLKSVSFCITKLDNSTFTDADGTRRLHQFGRRARQRVKRSNEASDLEARLAVLGVTSALIDTIRSKAPGVAFAAGRSSIYGFTHAGACNFDPDWSGLLIRRFDDRSNENRLYSDSDVNRTWNPYNIFDAFLFASCGELCAYPNGQNPAEWSPSDGFVPVFRKR